MENKEQEQLYTEGYNNGYLLNRFEPELYKKLMEGQQDKNIYFEGMREGGKAQAAELFLENLQKGRDMSEKPGPRMR